MIRVILPPQLQRFAGIEGELQLQLADPITIRAILDALETGFPRLQGTLRDPVSRLRRPKIRFFACGRDCSLESPDQPLPSAIAEGREPLRVVAAIAGG